MVTLKSLRNQSRHQSPQTLLESLDSGEHGVTKIPKDLLDFSQERNWLFFCGVVYLTCTANFWPPFLSAAGRTLEALIWELEYGGGPWKNWILNSRKDHLKSRVKRRNYKVGNQPHPSTPSQNTFRELFPQERIFKIISQGHSSFLMSLPYRSLLMSSGRI